MRHAFEVIAIFEGSWFTFITIYRKITRPFSSPHKTPFFSRWKSSTTEATKTTLIQEILNILPVAIEAQRLQLFITAICLVRGQILVIRYAGVRIIRGDCLLNFFKRGKIDMIVTYF